MNKVGVSQKVLIFNKQAQFLVILRGKTAPSNALRWDLPGGELDFGENATDSIVREVQEETGLSIESLSPFDVEAHIYNSDEYWVTIAYTAKVSDATVALGWEHEDYQWVNYGEFLKLKSIPKLVKFVKKHYRTIS